MRRTEKRPLLVDEYTSEYENMKLLESGKLTWYKAMAGKSPQPVLGRKTKYKDANWMP